MRIRRASLLILLAVTGSVRAVGAQNLVVNAHFDTTVDPWTVVTPVSTSLSWSSLDWQGSPTSGSGLVTNTATSGGVAVVQSPCLATTASGNYELGGQIRIPNPGNVGAAWVSVSVYGSPGCVGSATTVDAQHVPTSNPNVWVATLVRGISVIAGQSFRVDLNVSKQFFFSTLSAHFDFVRFGPEGTTPVQLQDFKVE